MVKFQLIVFSDLRIKLFPASFEVLLVSLPPVTGTNYSLFFGHTIPYVHNYLTFIRAETVLQKKGGKVIGASIPPIHLRLQYTPLTPITLEAPLPCPLTENQEGMDNGPPPPLTATTVTNNTPFFPMYDPLHL